MSKTKPLLQLFASAELAYASSVDTPLALYTLVYILTSVYTPIAVSLLAVGYHHCAHWTRCICHHSASPAEFTVPSCLPSFLWRKPGAAIVAQHRAETAKPTCQGQLAKRTWFLNHPAQFVRNYIFVCGVRKGGKGARGISQGGV